ncbi:hypothetical protein LINPERHAP1_LOCUS34924 [Linum perenne]
MIISAMETSKCHNIVSFKIVLLLLLSLVHISGINGSILKTIVSEDEIIDCVDIYKQPAFDHPLLKNHTIQLKPSSNPNRIKTKESINSSGHFQMWHRKGEYCPDGTIPILRSSVTDIPPKTPLDLNSQSPTPTTFVPEYAGAILSAVDDDYYGASAEINVWSPRIRPKELSVAQIWVSNNAGGNIETVEAGWMVTAFKPEAQFFTYWTYDGYGATGCYNLQCSGFVQTNPNITLGAQIEPVSVYEGDQRIIYVGIHKDMKTGNWWLNFQTMDIGYWPADLFKNLNASATVIEWGGKVISTNPNGLHTSTQMGSGRFPSEGFGKAAYFSNLEYVDGDGFPNTAYDVITHVTRPNCYDLDAVRWAKAPGMHFFYGGPGYSLSCQNGTNYG